MTGIHPAFLLSFPHADSPSRNAADSLSSDALLSFLSPAQLAAFQATLADPSKATALVDQEFDPDLPWWELPDQEVPAELRDGDDEDDGGEPALGSAKPPLLSPGELPPLRLVAGKPAVSPKLVYNVVAVL